MEDILTKIVSIAAIPLAARIGLINKQQYQRRLRFYHRSFSPRDWLKLTFESDDIVLFIKHRYLLSSKWWIYEYLRIYPAPFIRHHFELVTGIHLQPTHPSLSLPRLLATHTDEMTAAALVHWYYLIDTPEMIAYLAEVVDYRARGYSLVDKLLGCKLLEYGSIKTINYLLTKSPLAPYVTVLKSRSRLVNGPDFSLVPVNVLSIIDYLDLTGDVAGLLTWVDPKYQRDIFRWVIVNQPSSIPRMITYLSQHSTAKYPLLAVGSECHERVVIRTGHRFLLGSSVRYTNFNFLATPGFWSLTRPGKVFRGNLRSKYVSSLREDLTPQFLDAVTKSPLTTELSEYLTTQKFEQLLQSNQLALNTNSLSHINKHWETPLLHGLVEWWIPYRKLFDSQSMAVFNESLVLHIYDFGLAHPVESAPLVLAYRIFESLRLYSKVAAGAIHFVQRQY